MGQPVGSRPAPSQRPVKQPGVFKRLGGFGGPVLTAACSPNVRVGNQGGAGLQEFNHWQDAARIGAQAALGFHIQIPLAYAVRPAAPLQVRLGRKSALNPQQSGHGPVGGECSPADTSAKVKADIARPLGFGRPKARRPVRNGNDGFPSGWICGLVQVINPEPQGVRRRTLGAFACVLYVAKALCSGRQAGIGRKPSIPVVKLAIRRRRVFAPMDAGLVSALPKLGVHGA